MKLLVSLLLHFLHSWAADPVTPCTAHHTRSVPCTHGADTKKPSGNQYTFEYSPSGNQYTIEVLAFYLGFSMKKAMQRLIKGCFLLSLSHIVLPESLKFLFIHATKLHDVFEVCFQKKRKRKKTTSANGKQSPSPLIKQDSSLIYLHWIKE